jgi:hypothetical protein
MAGEQWCRVYWMDSSWTFTPGPGPWDGEIALWRWDGGSWRLADVLHTDGQLQQQLPLGERFGYKAITVPEPRLGPHRLRFGVAAVLTEQPLDAEPLEGASVTLVAGRGGTPTWDAPSARSDAKGIVDIGSVTGDMWYADVFKPGYNRVRAVLREAQYAVLRNAPFDARDTDWVLLSKASEVEGVVTIGGQPAPAGTFVKVGFPDRPGTLDLFYAVDEAGRFHVSEPSSTTVIYVARLHDGREARISRKNASETLRIDIK